MLVLESRPERDAHKVLSDPHKRRLQQTMRAWFVQEDSLLLSMSP